MRERKDAPRVYYVAVDQEEVLTDEEIAIRTQKGDVDMFGILMERYEVKLLRYGRKFLSRYEDIEDIVQDVFISAYKNIQSFDASLRFSPWIYRIAHNAFINALRKDERYVHVVDFDTLISHQVYEDPAESERELADMRALLDRGLGGIDSRYREVLVLHYYEEMAYKDIADVLQIPVGTVSIRMKRGKEALKKTIQHRL